MGPPGVPDLKGGCDLAACERNAETRFQLACLVTWLMSGYRRWRSWFWGRVPPLCWRAKESSQLPPRQRVSPIAFLLLIKLSLTSLASVPNTPADTPAVVDKPSGRVPVAASGISRHGIRRILQGCSVLPHRYLLSSSIHACGLRLPNTSNSFTTGRCRVVGAY